MRGRSTGAAGNGAGTSGLVCADSQAREGTTAETGGSSALAKLYIAGAPASAAEAAGARKAIRQGMDLLRWEGQSAPSLQAVIWRLLVDAVETDKRLPDRESRWRFIHNSWPPTMPLETEAWGAALQRFQIGDEGLQKPLPRSRYIDAQAEGRMQTVLGWLKYIPGRTPSFVVRNRLIILALAGGEGVARTRARYFRGDRSDSAVKYVKFRALQEIEKALRAMRVHY